MEENREMGIFEIISAIILIVACVFIVIVILMKETKTQMSQTISGNSSDSFYQKNSGRTKEAMLNKATITAAVVFFVLAVAVNVINVYFGGSKDNIDSSSNSSVSDEVSNVDDMSGIDLAGTAEGSSAVTGEAGGTSDSDASGEDSSSAPTTAE